LIEGYLPKAAGEEEVAAGVKAVIAEMNSPGMKDMGAVMKNAMARFSGAGMRVDGKLVSEAVRRELAGNKPKRTYFFSSLIFDGPRGYGTDWYVVYQFQQC